MMEECNKCSLGKNGKPVAGEGNKSADVFFIGQNPGKTEIKQGRPFVGKSGKLLRRLLDECLIDTDEVYISNLVKCLSEDNRPPFYDEIVVCSPYLLEEIRMVKPKLIVTLGKVVGDWFNHYKEWEWGKHYKERRWIGLFHPSYLLRAKQEIKDKWKQDLMKAVKDAECRF